MARLPKLPDKAVRNFGIASFRRTTATSGNSGARGAYRHRVLPFACATN